VVISQSWNEIHKVNDEIRAGLKTEKRIGSDETAIAALLPVDLTDVRGKRSR